MESKLLHTHLSDQELKIILADLYGNTMSLCKTLFPEDFSRPWTKLHYPVFDVIDNSKAKKICIRGARGFGKTTICEAIAKKAILYRDSRFIGYLSHSSTNSEICTENIKMDLLTNERIVGFGFPDISISSDGLNDETIKKYQFSKKAWVANGYSFILPRGAGQQVRGLKWIHYRPDIWIIDDLEDDEEVENEILRDKLKRWFYGALMKTVSRYDDNYRIIYIDTNKHEGALINEIMEDPDWEHLDVPAYVEEDGKYVTTDPNFVSQEELDKEIEAHREKGILDVLAREWGCQSTSREDNEFLGHIQYYKETDEEFLERLKYMETFVIADPAKTKKMTSAESGFVVAAIDVERGAIYIRLAIGRRLSQAEFLDTLFNLCAQYNARVFGVEVTGLEEHITYPIRNTQVTKKMTNLQFIELKARSGKGDLGGANAKIGRARGVIPLYQQGLVYHNKVGTADLEVQQLSFPRPKRWDVLDCCSYIPQMLEVGLRYMEPAYVHDEDQASIEEEYKVLENEPALEEDWKI